MKSIQSKFLTSVIVGLLVIALAVGLCAYLMTNQLLHEKADILLDTHCASEAAVINDTLGDLQKSVQIMSWYCMAELESSESLKDPAYLAAYSNKLQKMFSTVAANTNQALTFYLHFSPELTSPSAGFYMRLAGKDEAPIALVPTDLSLFDPGDPLVSWYYTPVNSGQPVWLAPYTDRNLGILMISYIMPLYHQDTLIGVVGMDIDFSALHEMVSEVPIYQNSTAYLTDAAAHVVHQHPDQSGRYTMEASAALINGMNLVLKADFLEVIRESYPILIQSSLIFIVLLVVFILYLFSMTRRITTPLKKLTVAAQQLVDGGISPDLNCRTDDEIGVLANAFKQAAVQLHTRMSTMNDLAFRDSLTGVKSRVAYVSAVATIDQQLAEGKRDFGVVVFDSNNLKYINDRYGHDQGNAYICHICTVICNVYKHSPVYRIGGDEFVVILEGHDLEQRRKLLEQLGKAFAESPFSLEDQQLPTRVAYGMAVYDHSRDQEFNDVFIRADKAMYQHKRKLKQQYGVIAGSR
ncbi:MAG: diguanylate cyclase [Clostridia bacterium]|nr:diguanylate cyclase [Clostridia bacterium]